MNRQITALALALAAALSIDVGLLLLKVRGDRVAGRAEGCVRALLAGCVRDPLWLLGLFLQPLGYGLYLWALELAPLYIVQTIMSSGVIIFVLFAVCFLGERLTRLEWAGVGAVVVGMILLGTSLTTGTENGQPHNDPHVVFYLSLILVGLAGLTWLALVTLGAPEQRGMAVAVVSGILLGLASIYARGLALVLAQSSPGQLVRPAVASPYAWLTLLANLAGFVLLLAAFHGGRASIVLALSATLSNVVPILAAMLALGERLPVDRSLAVARLLALVLTLGGAALLIRLNPSALDR
ncbi:MAG: EamA family transporter [Candidatus Methylomirabilaceae bacterium]